MLGFLKNVWSKLFAKRNINNPDYSKKLRFYNFSNFKDHKIFLDAIGLSLNSDDKDALSRVKSVLPNYRPSPISKVLSETGIDFGVDDIFVYDVIAKLGNSCNVIEWDGHYNMYVIGGAKRSGDIPLRFALYIGHDQQLHAYIPQIGNSYDVLNKKSFKESDKLVDVIPTLEMLVERLVKASRTSTTSVSAVISSQLNSIRGSDGFEWSDNAVLADLPHSIRCNLLVDYVAIDMDIKQAFHLPADVELLSFHPEYKCDFNKKNCIQLISQWSSAEEDRLRNKCTIYDIRSMQDEGSWRQLDKGFGSKTNGLFDFKGMWLYRQSFIITSTDFEAVAEIITDHKGCDLICFNVKLKSKNSIGEDNYSFNNITEESNEYTKSQNVSSQVYSKA